MNKRTVAVLMSSALLFNSFQVAFAGSKVAAQVDQTEMSLEQMNEALNESNPLRIQETKIALSEITSLIAQIKAISSNQENDVILEYGKYVQLALLGISAHAMDAHLKKDEALKLRMSASVAALLLNKVLSVYKERHSLDSKTLSNKLTETYMEIASRTDLPKEVIDVQEKLIAMNAELTADQGLIQDVITNSGAGQNIALIASVGYLVLHFANPKLAKEADAAVQEVGAVRKILQDMLVASKAGKFSGTMAMGSTVGAGGLQDVLEMTLGMSSERAQTKANSALMDLNSQANKLRAEIAKRSGDLK